MFAGKNHEYVCPALKIKGCMKAVFQTNIHLCIIPTLAYQIFEKNVQFAFWKIIQNVQRDDLYAAAIT